MSIKPLNHLLCATLLLCAQAQGAVSTNESEHQACLRAAEDNGYAGAERRTFIGSCRRRLACVRNANHRRLKGEPRYEFLDHCFAGIAQTSCNTLAKKKRLQGDDLQEYLFHCKKSRKAYVACVRKANSTGKFDYSWDQSIKLCVAARLEENSPPRPQDRHPSRPDDGAPNLAPRPRPNATPDTSGLKEGAPNLPPRPSPVLEPN